jgi:hypothetical protein
MVATESAFGGFVLTAAFRTRSLTVAMTCWPWGHGKGFAEPHAHHSVAGVRTGTAMTVLTIGDARCFRADGVTAVGPRAAGVRERRCGLLVPRWPAAHWYG